MATTEAGQGQSGNMPEEFDRLLGTLHGLPDVVRTSTATVRHVPPLGVGGTELWSVQTYRQRERGDVVFLEVVRAGGQAIRLVLPPKVVDTIARQRDALTAKVRSRAARATAAERKARGERPAFLRRKPAAAG